MSAVAAVDCGTNSTRLLVLSQEGSELARELRLTRLGEGVHVSRTLSDAAIERTVAALSEYRAIADRCGVGRIRVAATSAARDAVNSQAFFDAAEAAIGVRPELLSGEEEGRLTFQGATADLRRGHEVQMMPRLVVDIGGGSTEFVLGDGRGVRFASSLDVGCVRLTERCLRGDPPAAEELSDAFDVVRDHLSDLELDLGSRSDRGVAGGLDRGVENGVELVGVAGTVTTLAALDLGLDQYEPQRTHGHVLTRDRVETLFRDLAAQTVASRATDPLLPPKRADVIVAGAIILLATMRQFGFDTCSVSEQDILDGLANSLLGS